MVPCRDELRPPLPGDDPVDGVDGGAGEPSQRVAVHVQRPVGIDDEAAPVRRQGVGVIVGEGVGASAHGSREA